MHRFSAKCPDIIGKGNKKDLVQISDNIVTLIAMSLVNKHVASHFRNCDYLMCIICKQIEYM